MPSERRPRVMIVDDEENLRVSLGQILSTEFEVSLFSGAQDALKAIAAGDEVDAVLCDLMMPRMSGVDLYEAVGAVAPALQGRFIFLSGGAFTPRTREFLERIPNARLEKPFSIAELRDALRALIEG